MQIALIAVDMDGTFLRPDLSYDRQRFLGLRERMRDAGVRFVVASGNQYWQLRSFFEPEDEVAYAAENGHFLYDVGDTSPCYAAVPRPDVARVLVAELEEHRLTYLASTSHGAVIPSWLGPDGVAWARRYYPRVEIVEDVRAVADDIVKASVQAEDPHAVVAELGRRLGDRFVPVVAGPTDADLNAPGHNKAVGLGRLAERWGIDLADAVAFGDSYNDREMLTAVGLPVVMSDAPPDLRELAARIAPPNSADGVLAVLEEILPS
ncbi:MAG: Cof-type HAD-IIB family hydrolase [Micropruina sp.]|uniref:Cof-type HAD-IIB family hydrolase n=1 Tax=Micropruina sp. TaxID=2737536 RepID=UPI0039E23EDF